MAANKDLNRLKVILAEKEEVQSLAIQRVGLFAYNCIQVVHKLITAPVGNVDEDNQIT